MNSHPSTHFSSVDPPGTPMDDLTPEQQERLSELLDEYLTALEQGRPVDRERLLADNPQLARPLADYLDSLELLRDAAGGLQLPNGFETPSPVRDGRRLGDFHLLREIGRGGMGVVYEAWQIPLNRRVALKVLPYNALFDAKQITRFRNEAQAAGQLHHPRIVPVYAVGSDQGVHYYAMQLIDGQPLDRVIEAIRQAAPAAQKTSRKIKRDSQENKNDAVVTRVAPSFDRTRPSPWREEVTRIAPPDHPTAISPARETAAEKPLPENHAEPQKESPFSEEVAERRPVTPPSRDDLLTVVDSRPTVGPAPAPSGHSRSDASAPSSTAPSGRLAEQYAGDVRRYYRSSAELVIQVAEALQAAHEEGVVHRDVKPSNLLLDREGRLWITDFGLARCRDDAHLTRTGDLIGTIRYMSPEQTQGRERVVDHRTDVYSLGVTLYELLTLHHAVRGGDAAAALRELDREQPYPPRLWDRRIPADLENIVLKAIAKSPDQRYATAGALAEDLRRFLAGLPTIARRPSALEQFGIWARRHSGLLASLLTSLFLGMVVLLVAMVLMRHAHRQADAAREEAENNMAQYQAQLALADAHLALLYWESGDVDDAEKALARAIAVQKSILRQEKLPREIVYQLAESLNNLAFVHANDSPEQALDCLRTSLDFQDRLPEDASGNPEYAALRGMTLSNLATVRRRQGQTQAAMEAYLESVRLLEGLVAHPEAPLRLREDLAVTLNNLATLQLSRDQFSQAASTYQRALRHFVAAHPNAQLSRDQSSMLGSLHLNLAYGLERLQELRDAATNYEQAAEFLRAARDLGRSTTRDTELLRKCYDRGARVEQDLGNHQRAADYLARLLPLAADDPDQLLRLFEQLDLLAWSVRQAAGDFPPQQGKASPTERADLARIQGLALDVLAALEQHDVDTAARIDHNQSLRVLPHLPEIRAWLRHPSRRPALESSTRRVEPAFEIRVSARATSG